MKMITDRIEVMEDVRRRAGTEEEFTFAIQTLRKLRTAKSLAAGLVGSLPSLASDSGEGREMLALVFAAAIAGAQERGLIPTDHKDVQELLADVEFVLLETEEVDA